MHKPIRRVKVEYHNVYDCGVLLRFLLVYKPINKKSKGYIVRRREETISTKRFIVKTIKVISHTPSNTLAFMTVMQLLPCLIAAKHLGK